MSGGSVIPSQPCIEIIPRSHLSHLERRVCSLIVLAERVAVAPNQWLGRSALQQSLVDFCPAELCAVARLPQVSSVFWWAAQVLAHCDERDVREAAAATILNFKSVHWRASQSPRPEPRRRVDLS